MGDIAKRCSNIRPAPHRPKTLSVREMKRQRRKLPVAVDAALDVERPRTRAECVDGPRPCPFVSCRHHLFLDVKPDNGSIVFNALGELEDMPDTCALDVADRGQQHLEVVAERLGMTRENVRQIEQSAFARVRDQRPELADMLEEPDR